MFASARRALTAVTLTVLCACSAPVPPILPDVMLAGVPNLSQFSGGFDEEAYAPDQLCAPVAVSNSLAWLGDNHDRAAQVELVNRLAHVRYMMTSPSVGTGPAGLITGVRRYLQEQGWEIRQLAYAGIRAMPVEFGETQALSLAWLHEGLADDSAVWVNFGWYGRELPGVYRRLGGHWMTLVGFDSGALVLHDPATGQQVIMPVKLQAWTLTKVDSWRLVRGALAVAASEAHRGDFALVDGAVRLELAPR